MLNEKGGMTAKQSLLCRESDRSLAICMATTTFVVLFHFNVPYTGRFFHHA